MGKYLGLTRQQLSDLFNYAYRLSLVVEPSDAEKIGLKNFNGAICLLFRDFSDLQGDKVLNIDTDYFYKDAYERIVKDLGDKRYDCN